VIRKFAECQIFTPNARIGSGSLLLSLTKAMEQKRLWCEGSRLPRLQSCPGGQVINSQPAPAHSPDR